MTRDKLIEEMAEELYKFEGGIDPEEYLVVFGREKRRWRIEGVPWDLVPEEELCEHERDEYRTQARVLLEFLEAKKLVKEDGYAT